MSTATEQLPIQRSGHWFALGLAVFGAAAFLLTQQLPLTVSMVAVFLFAGPHNYLEFRYFLTRLPARAGKLKGYFCLSIAGVLALSMFYPAISMLATRFRWSSQTLLVVFGLWNTVFIGWVAGLAWIRSRQPPRHDWWFILPSAIFCTGLSWFQPIALPLLMVFAHPLMGLWILDRELTRSRPGWKIAYRSFLLSVPIVVLVFVLVPSTTGRAGTIDQGFVSGMIQMQISRHVGADLFPGDLGQRLIGLHAFLELMHYGVWIVAIPIASGRVFSHPFQVVPLMRAAAGTRRSVQMLLTFSLLIVVVLWFGFIADYSQTRDLYFTVATLHVFAEIPFLLRLL
ncbi:MAG: hypothetical protein JNL58_18725 [Planctomyces sp.]|nr:hypothetical protein [Planctomyces sp.]